MKHHFSLQKAPRNSWISHHRTKNLHLVPTKKWSSTTTPPQSGSTFRRRIEWPSTADLFDEIADKQTPSFVLIFFDKTPTHLIPQKINLKNFILHIFIEFTFFFGGGILVLLVFGDQIVHVGFGFGEFHLVHTFTGVPV